MPLSRDEFTQQVTASGLLDAASVAESLSSLPPDKQPQDGEQLARELVKQKKLTKFQAEQLYAGKGKSLTLGNYVILDKLGQGGMGMVLKAQHQRMKRVVALKVMSPTAVKSADALKRFHREVEAAAKLTHPNIVAAFDADEAKGTHFLVMEYVEGDDLSALVKKHGPLPVEQAIRCIIQAARGLEFAHEQGIIHRDIKPANLLIDSKGTVKILDMGLARIDGAIGGSSEGAGLTNTGTIMGTVDYMSPEQAMDTKHADARSDIYSLGCTLYSLLTGKVVYDGDTMMKKLMAHQNAPIPDVSGEWRVGSGENDTKANSSTLHSPLSTLNSVFRRMVAKKPGDRPQTMTQVIAELERCLSGGSPTVAFERSTDSATVSGVSGSGNELHDFLRQISADGGSTATSAAPSSVDAETMISSAGDGGTDPRTEQSLTIEASRSQGGQKKKTVLLGSIAVAVVMFLGIVFAIRGQSGTLHLQITEELIEVTIGNSSRVLKGVTDVKVRLPLGEHVLHVKRDDIAFDTEAFEVTKGDPIAIKVERVGRRVRAMQGSTLLGHKESAKSKEKTTASPAAPDFALEFALSGRSVEIPLASLDPNQPWTLEGYIQPDDIPDHNQGLPANFGGDAWRLNLNHWSMRLVELSAPFGKGGTENVLAETSMQSLRGKRFHVAAVYADKLAQLFVDGKLVGGAPSKFLPKQYLGKLTLGARFQGTLDEWRISKVGRYEKDFTPPKRYEPDANTLALYHFDEGTGDVLKDSSGNNHHGKIIGAKWVKGDGSATPTSPNRSRYALSFAGTQKVEVGTLKLVGAAPYTIEGYLTKHEHKGGVSVLFGCHNKLWFTNRFADNLEFYVGQKDAKPVFVSAGTLPRDERVHVAGVWSGSSITVFLNGKLIATKPTSDTPLAENAPGFIFGEMWRGTFDTVRVSKAARYTKDFTPANRFEPDADTLALYHFDEGQGDVLKDSSGNNHHGKIVGAKWVKSDGGAAISDDPDRRAAEWVLSAGGNVGVREVSQTKVGDRIMVASKLPSGLYKVHMIGLGHKGKQVSEAGLENLLGLTEITDIDLNYCQNVSDQSLKQLGTYQTLKSLFLCNTAITDNGVEDLRTLINLTRLDLRDTQVTAAGVAKLQQALPKCKIDWNGGKLATSDDPDRRAAELLVGHATLTVKLASGQLLPVSRNGKLPTERFVVKYVYFGTDSPIPTNEFVSRTLLPALAGVREVSTLECEFRRVKFTEDEFRQLARMPFAPNLIKLRVDIGLTPKTSADFDHFPKLQVLGLGVKGASDELLISTFGKLTNVSMLHLWDLGSTAQVTDRGLAALVRLPLQDLVMESTHVPQSDLARHVARLPDLKQLRWLYGDVPDAAFAELAACPKLESLTIDPTPVTDAGLQALGKRASLRQLALIHTKNVTAAGIAKLQQALPNCKINSPDAKSVTGGDAATATPFVTLRNGAAVARHATLEEALDASQSQDVIEVHGNGPFPISDSKRAFGKGGRTITLKGASGFRPLFVPAPDFDSSSSSPLFGVYGDAARFEGIDVVTVGPKPFEFHGVRDVVFVRCRCVSTTNLPGNLMGFRCATDQRVSFTDCLLVSARREGGLQFVNAPATVEMTNTFAFAPHSPLNLSEDAHALKLNRCTVIGGSATIWNPPKTKTDPSLRGLSELSRCLVLGPSRIGDHVRWQGKENVYGLSQGGHSGAILPGNANQTFDDWVNSPAKPETGSKLVPTKAKTREELLDADPKTLFRKLKTYLEELRALHPDVGADPSVADGLTVDTAASNGWLDVLPLIDPQRDKLEYPNLTGKNDWQMRDGELVYTGDAKNGKLVFPVKITGPHVEVEFDITRTSGAGHINIDLPSAKGPIPIELSRSGSIVQLGWPAVVVGKHSTKLGQRITYLVKIAKVEQQDVIDVFADGVSIGHWQGQRDAIGKPDPVKYPQATSSGFWTNSNTNWTIHRVRVRAPGGSVEPTRSASAIPPSSGAADSTAVNLLSKLDTAAIASNTKASITNGTLKIAGGRLPLPVDPPPAEYDVKLRVERKSAGNAVVLGLVSGSRPVALVMDGFQSRGGLWGLENIAGKGPTDNGTAVPKEPLPVDQPVDVVVQVRKAGIRVERDGKPLIDWKGSPDKLSLAGNWDDKGPPRLFLGAQASFVIHRLELLPVAGGPKP